MIMVRQLLQRIRKFRQDKALILMYHQVCERSDDPWELAVHPGNFYEQLDYLRKNFQVVPVADLANGITRGKVGSNAVAITFDDGFRDNYTTAAPILDWFNMPAAFYVSTRSILEERIYWWEVLQHVLFHTEVLPARFEMVIAHELLTFAFRSDRALCSRAVNQIRAWNSSLPVPNERVALYMLLWSRLKSLAHEEQSTALDELRAWAGVADFTSCPAQTMSVREVRMLAESPLFSIGAHTVHHSMLSRQDRCQQDFEVRESKRQIEKWLGKPVSGFAYPYGNFNSTTRDILKEAGFTYGLSTESRPVTAEADPYALPRIQVKNWSVYEFGSKIKELVYG